MEDQQAIKPASVQASLNDHSHFARQGNDAPTTGLGIFRMKPQSPGLSIKGIPGKALNFFRSHPRSVEPITHIFQVGITELLQDSLEVGTFKEALSRIVFWETSAWWPTFHWRSLKKKLASVPRAHG